MYHSFCCSIPVEKAIKKKSRRKNTEEMEESVVDPSLSKKILKHARAQQVEEAAIPSSLNGAVPLERRTEAPAKGHARGEEPVENASGQWSSEEEQEEGEDSEHYLDDIPQLTEEEERDMAMFMKPTEEQGPSRTLADMIMEKIAMKEAGMAAQESSDPFAGVHPKIRNVYEQVGQLLSRYKSGKLPRAFKIIPSLSNWEEVLALTNPAKWTPQAMYQATRLFASNLGASQAQRFYALVLLPAVRGDIEETKKLNYHYYMSLKKALYKPAAFYKGFLLPLCESRDCTVREAVIISSVLKKVSIPLLESAAALLKLSEMEYCGTTSYFMQIILNKKYALPYRVIDAMVIHFLGFGSANAPKMPAIWHSCLLVFCQRYKNDMTAEQKEAIKATCRIQVHPGITPEVHRELDYSTHRLEGTAAVAPAPQDLVSQLISM